MMNMIAFFGLVDFLEVSMVCVTAIAIVGILAKYSSKNKAMANGCGCEFCGAHEHNNKPNEKKE